jgi:proteic killer suppression protein
LDRLGAAKSVEDMRFPEADLHPLKGDMKGLWAVKVSGNWRVTFTFHGGNAYIIDYVDYH